MQLSPGTAFLRQAGSAARGLATCRLRSTLQKRAAPGTTNGDGTRPLAVRPAMLPVIAGKRCCSSCARVLFYRLQGLRAQRQVWGAQIGRWQIASAGCNTAPADTAMPDSSAAAFAQRVVCVGPVLHVFVQVGNAEVAAGGAMPG